MEFPDVGKHCENKLCNRLDFLPVKCDACLKIFCKDHIHYINHACPSSYKKDVQVPVCPLCNAPVPVNRGELPDIKVGAHIDNDCQSDPAKTRRKSDAHRCTVKGCKGKEFVPVICSSCRQNFCLGHRNPMDHKCKGFQNSGRSINETGLAALNRQRMANSDDTKKNGPCSSSSANKSNSVAEDEMLARAIQLSLNESGEKKELSQEQLDRMLAEALARGEDEFDVEEERQRNNSKKSCVVV